MKPVGSGCSFALLESLLALVWVFGWLALAACIVVPVAGLLGAEGTFASFEVRTTSSRPPLEAAGPGGTWEVASTRTGLTTPPGSAWVGSLVLLPFVALFVLALGQLRGIVRSLRDGPPFIRENARRLRRIGFLALGFEGTRLLVVFLVVRPLVAHLDVGSASFRVVYWPEWHLVLLGLAMLVLAEVFRHGTAMREELELTV